MGLDDATTYVDPYNTDGRIEPVRYRASEPTDSLPAYPHDDSFSDEKMDALWERTAALSAASSPHIPTRREKGGRMSRGGFTRACHGWLRSSRSRSSRGCFCCSGFPVPGDQAGQIL